jgi:hypothetical protein
MWVLNDHLYQAFDAEITDFNTWFAQQGLLGGNKGMLSPYGMRYAHAHTYFLIVDKTYDTL